MDLIFDFISRYMSFLWKGARFRVVGSTVATTNGGSGELFVESEVLKLRFFTDRRQLMLDFASKSDPQAEQFSSDLVWRLILDEGMMTGLLTEEFALFFAENLSRIESQFSESEWPGTRLSLVKLRKLRAKELFG